MDKSNIIFFLIITLFLILSATGSDYFIESKLKENFDLTTDLVHFPYIGKFDDCYQIGSRRGFSHQMCKNLCNKMESCKGISYRGKPSYECRLYNDTTLLKDDPRFISWFNFWNKMY